MPPDPEPVRVNVALRLLRLPGGRVWVPSQPSALYLWARGLPSALEVFMTWPPGAVVLAVTSRLEKSVTGGRVHLDARWTRRATIMLHSTG